jgi:alpha-galactosidase
MVQLRKALTALVSSGALVAGGLAATAVTTTAVVATASPATAVDDGLAALPPMGFNDWNSFGCDVDADLIERTADLFVSSGLKDAGYEYVNIDDCWMTHQRDAVTGRLVPDPVKFPDGIKAVADYVHAKGLKLGIYESAGSETCAHYPGSLGHETVDAQSFADWGVDYLKYDNCGDHGSYPDTKAGFIARYKAMGDALKATGRPMVYSLCEWGQQEPWTWGADFSHLWRTTGDISDNWTSMRDIVRQNAPLAQYAGPGAWNDPDMLEVGNGGMTDREYRTHFSLWSVMNAPLIIGTDLRKATPATMEILSNREVIALNQDPLAKQATVVSDRNGARVFAKPLANGDVAVALYNETDSPQTISTTASAVGLSSGSTKTYRLRDLWSKTEVESAGTIGASVPAHATKLFRVSPLRGFDAFAPATSLSVSLPTAGDSIAEPGSTVTLGSTFADYGKHKLHDVRVSATAPAGWTVQPAGATGTSKLGTDESLGGRWTVTVPAGTAPGRYDLAVTATYLWGEDAVRTGSERSTLTVVVPQTPPSGSTPLSDIAWVSATNGWGTPEKDRSNGEQGASDGHTITINGVTYDKGIGAHANSEIRYYLGGKCSTLTTDVGVDDEKTEKSSITFRLLADDQVKADSGVLTATDPAKHLSADLTGARWLTLVQDAGSSNDSDHGDWAGPVLTCS